MNEDSTAVPSKVSASTTASGTHTPEPWRSDSLAHVWRTFEDEQGRRAHSPIAEVYGLDKELALANARRIVACVNTCAGISSAALEHIKFDPPSWEASNAALRARVEELEAQLEDDYK